MIISRVFTFIILGICHDIKGTDGTQFPPGLDKDKRLWMFVSDLCRSIWVDFEQEVKVQGLKAYRYRPPKDVFDMGNPDNFCYCPDFLECACPTGNFTGKNGYHPIIYYYTCLKLGALSKNNRFIL